MYIIQINASENGSRPALQEWHGNIVPDGYAVCPQEFYDIFYSTSPAGFVNIEVARGSVKSMAINQEALDAYIANLPEVEPESRATDTEVLNALLGIETEDANG